MGPGLRDFFFSLNLISFVLSLVAAALFLLYLLAEIISLVSGSSKYLYKDSFSGNLAARENFPPSYLLNLIVSSYLYTGPGLPGPTGSLNSSVKNVRHHCLLVPEPNLYIGFYFLFESYYFPNEDSRSRTGLRLSERSF